MHGREQSGNIDTDMSIIRIYGQPCLTALATNFHAGFLHGLVFDPEDRAKYSHETSVDFQRIIRRHNPNDITLLTN
jgi:hypothetical protein